MIIYCVTGGDFVYGHWFGSKKKVKECLAGFEKVGTKSYQVAEFEVKLSKKGIVNLLNRLDIEMG